MDNMNSTNKTNHFIDGSPVYYNIEVSGTPTDLKNGFYYGEVNFTSPKTGKKVIIWFSYSYSSSLMAYAECYEKMCKYINSYPVIDP